MYILSMLQQHKREGARNLVAPGEVASECLFATGRGQSRGEQMHRAQIGRKKERKREREKESKSRREMRIVICPTFRTAHSHC